MSENQRPRESRVLSFGSGKIQESPVEVLYSRTQGVVRAYQEALRVSCIRTRIRIGGEKGRYLLLYHGLCVRQTYPKEGEPGLHREVQRSGTTPKGALAGRRLGPRANRPARKIVPNGFKLVARSYRQSHPHLTTNRKKKRTKKKSSYARGKVAG